MPSDAEKPPVGSMSAEQLEERLEKSEAGRKKLRQAISILQEKLDATEKVLKINDTLRQECERERQRAEEEKKQAEEEKRIRFAVEKDSATFKEQLVKVLKRLGVVENRQKSDKKEIDRLRAEVKLAVEGTRTAAQAVDAVQSSFQCLESAVLEKVEAAVQRVNAVSQEVNAVQSSLQNLGKKISEKTELVSKPVLYNERGNQLQVSVDKKSAISNLDNRPEKLVDNITHLFLKERKSHLKIEQKLAVLKDLLKRSRNDGILSNTSVDFVSKDVRSSKRRRADKLGKKRPMQDEDLAGSKPRKKTRLTQEDEIRNNFSGKSSEREEQTRNQENSSFFDMAKTSGMLEKPESLLRGTFKAHLVQMPSTEGRGLPKGSCDDGLISLGEDVRSSKRSRADKPGKKISMQGEDLAGSKPRKKTRLTQEDENRNNFFGKNIEREEQTRNQENTSFFDIAKTSGRLEKPESLLRSTFKTHLVQIPEGRGLPKRSCDDGLISPGEDPKMIQVDCHQKVGKESLKFGSNIHESTRSVHFSEAAIKGSEEDLDLDSSDSELELDWLSGEKTLLSPNLPEVSSPVCDSPSSFMDPSVHEICTAISPELTVGQPHVAFQSDEAVLNSAVRACTVKPNEQDNSGFQGDFENLGPCIEYGKNRTTLSVSVSSSQFGCVKEVELKPSVETRGQVASGTAVSQPNGCSHTQWDCEHIKGKETRGTGHVQIDQSKQDEVLIQTTCTSITCDRDGCMSRQDQTFESFTQAFPGSSSLSALKSDISNLSGRTEDTVQHFNGDFGFEAVDNNIIKEMNNFLEDLPSISCPSANEIPSNVSRVPFEIQMIDYDYLKSCESSCSNSKDTFGNNFSTSVNDVSTNDSNVLVNGLLNQGGNSQPDERTEFPTASDRSNIVAGNMGSQLTAKSSCQLVAKQSSNVISLLQGFDLHIVEGDINLTMTAVVAIKVKRYLSFTGWNSQQAELQEALVSFRTNLKLPIEYIACSFISSIVDMVSLESKGECSSPKAKSFSVLLQTFIALIESVFKERATAILDIIFTQLSRFLNEGKMILMAFQGIEGLSEDVFVSAGLIECNSLLSCRTSGATLEDAHAGSKVLAGLCQVLSCVSHLQTVVYEVLGWCDKDTTWLLTIFSSFASICGHTFFMLGPDDLLGHTICAIVSELVSSADRDSVKGVEVIDQALKCSADVSVCFQMPKGWDALKGSPRIEGKFSLEAALLSVLVALCHILSLTNDSLLSGSQLVLKDSLLGINEKVEQSSPRGVTVPTLPETQHNKTAVPSNKEVGMPEAAFEQRLSQQDIDKILYTQDSVKENSETVEKRHDYVSPAQEQEKFVIPDWKKWRRKYCEVMGALELIALYMGWEWTYNDLIVGHLWRMVVSGSAKISVAVISHVIGILGRFGVDSEGKELPGLEEWKRCLVSVLHSKPTTTATSDKYCFSSLSQAAAAHALLKLDNTTCVKRNDSNKSGDIDSHIQDPNVQNCSSPSSVHMEYVKKWLYDAGIESQEALSKFLKKELTTISNLLPP